MARVLNMNVEEVEDAGESAVLTLNTDGTFSLETNSFQSEGMDLSDTRIHYGTYTETASTLQLTCTSFDRDYSFQTWEDQGENDGEKIQFTGKSCNFTINFSIKGGVYTPTTQPPKGELPVPILDFTLQLPALLPRL
eukprot:TRINITY_DN128_c0_g5_i1.p1 TRINITY_DN128_c0_g5~~TRINITY_DN128_c0_g5_i1.p1  ORF type:complete len:137 (+),score=22.19 TRINITY_DN128_c0_g5_i1:55-465(+)